MDTLIHLFEKAAMIEADNSMNQEQKDLRLAQLMTAMERKYNIPMLRNEQWERDNPFVIRIYREISNMRSL